MPENGSGENPGTGSDENPARNPAETAAKNGAGQPEDALPRGLRAVVVRAIDEAARRGSGTVEAEHLLLAVAADQRSVAATALAASGLGYDAIDAALREERRSSLITAGVTPVDAARLQSTPRQARPTWGASVREALRRGHAYSSRHHRRRMVEVDTVIGILRADLGTVPRALAIAGVDRGALVERLQRL
jgi:ATP-dependent Clp protease ATP-binding subunit ClpA